MEQGARSSEQGVGSLERRARSEESMTIDQKNDEQFKKTEGMFRFQNFKIWEKAIEVVAKDLKVSPEVFWKW